MALVFDNAVREVDQSTTPATDDFLLDATDVVSGHQGFDAAGIANADTVYYEAQQVSAGAVIHREVGIGTWNDTTKTLSRSPIWSTAGALTKASFTLNPNVLVTVASEAFTGFSQDKAGFVPGPTAADISSNFVLRADGTWVAAGAAGGVSVSGTPVDDQIAIWTGATAIEGVTELTWNDTDKRLTIAGTATPGIILQNTTPADADTEKWQVYTDATGVFRLSAVNAAEATTAMAISVNRTGDVAFSSRVFLVTSPVTPPINVGALSAAPTTPTTSDVYLDDGTNTASGNPGWRRYTGVAWEDISAASGGAITALNNATENELVTVGATTTELDAEANLTWDGAGVLSAYRNDTGELAQINLGPSSTRRWQFITHGFSDFAGHTGYTLQIKADVGANDADLVVTDPLYPAGGLYALVNAGITITRPASTTGTFLTIDPNKTDKYSTVRVSEYGTLSLSLSGTDPYFNTFGASISGDTSSRLAFGIDTQNPFLGWGSGSSARDVFLVRTTTQQLAFRDVSRNDILTVNVGSGAVTIPDGNLSITETAPGANVLTVTSATNPTATTLVVNGAGTPTGNVAEFQVGGSDKVVVREDGKLQADSGSDGNSTGMMQVFGGRLTVSYATRGVGGANPNNHGTFALIPGASGGTSILQASNWGGTNPDLVVRTLDHDNQIFLDWSSGYVGINTANPATSLEVAEDETITGNVTDDYAAAITLDPEYSANSASSFTITRHNYIDINDVVAVNDGAGTLTVTDACVMRFDAAAGTHAAVDSGTTKTTPGTVDAWLKVNVNGTIYYLPMYTSKTT